MLPLYPSHLDSQSLQRIISGAVTPKAALSTTGQGIGEDGFDTMPSFALERLGSGGLGVTPEGKARITI